MTTAATGPAPAAVTVLGLGPMGRALAGALLTAGHRVTVWNRTPEKAAALTARGAHQAATPAEAAAASDLTIVSVIDYDAAEAVVTPAADALRGRTLVNLTADTPARGRAMAAWAHDHAIGYLDGAVMSPTAAIGTDHAVVLYSGPEEEYRTHRATLAAFGGTAAHLGADPGRAAAFDVALLDLFWTLMTGYAHAVALARAEQVTAAELAPFAQGIIDLMPGILAEAPDIDRGHHPGDEATLLSATATLDHLIHVSESHGIDAAHLSAARTLARRAIADGHGGDGFTRIVEVLRPRTR